MHVYVCMYTKYVACRRNKTGRTKSVTTYMFNREQKKQEDGWDKLTVKLLSSHLNISMKSACAVSLTVLSRRWSK